MIRYALHCPNGHEFEGWFGSSSEFDSQQGKGLLECPMCGSHDIAKTLMAPAVTGTRDPRAAFIESDHSAPEEDVKTPATQIAGLTDEQRAIVGQMRELKQKLLEKAENVGEKFSEEARKIHYGEAPERGIYGKASADEAAELIDEGIEFLPLPDLPEENN